MKANSLTLVLVFTHHMSIVLFYAVQLLLRLQNVILIRASHIGIKNDRRIRRKWCWSWDKKKRDGNFIFR